MGSSIIKMCLFTQLRRIIISPSSPYNIEWLVRIAVIISLVAVLTGIWVSYSNGTTSKNKINQSVQIRHLSHQLDNDYQNLSKSLKWSINTGDKHWKTRFETSRMKLIAKLQQISQEGILGGERSPSNDLVQRTKAFRLSLEHSALIEYKIFSHLDKKQKDQAFIIFSDFDYQQTKLTEQQTFNALQRALQQQATHTINSLNNRSSKITALLSLQMFGIVALWLYVSLIIRRWRNKQKLRSDELLHLAQHDALTGIGNRALFEHRISDALTQSRRNSNAVGLMLIDVDHFKAINDQFGHAVGDRLLLTIATELVTLSRESDTVIRLGGDEFAIILTNLTSQYHASIICKKVLSLFNQPITIDNQSIKTSVSIGIASFPNDAQNYDELLRKADMALYETKRKGKNDFQFFDTAIDMAAKQKIDMQDDLMTALKLEQFSLNYQPIIDMNTQQIVCVETLLRWQHPKKGNIPVNDFIAIAEENRLILPLGEWALKQACMQQVLWQQQGLSTANVAVNLSALQFHQPDLLITIENIIQSTGIQYGKLTVEITESTLMEQTDLLITKLHALRSLGVNIAIDDFGTGYSSLTYLRRFPINHLKIDREFTSELPNNQRDAAVTRSIIKMAHELGISVIAEGIERQDQLQFLNEADCDLGQGFYVAKPMNSNNFALWLTRHQQQSKSNIRSIR